MPDRIFISYSCKDQEYFDVFRKHLRVALGDDERLEIWTDTKIQASEDWHRGDTDRVGGMQDRGPAGLDRFPGLGIHPGAGATGFSGPLAAREADPHISFRQAQCCRRAGIPGRDPRQRRDPAGPDYPIPGTQSAREATQSTVGIRARADPSPRRPDHP